MPVAPTYPGVYIEEVPSGVRTITGVATSIAAFVGRALRGPLNDPVVINGFGEFERIFGGLWRVAGLGYAVRDFFENGGGQAIVVRVHKEGSDAGTATVAYSGMNVSAASPGQWGASLRIRVEHVTDTALVQAAAATQGLPDTTEFFNLLVHDSATGETEEFRNLTAVSGPRQVADVVNAQSRLIRVTNVPAARPAPAHAAVPDDVPANEMWTDDTASLPVPNASSGSNGDPITDTEVIGSMADKTGIYALGRADLFNLLVIPPYAPGGDIGDDVVEKAMAYCEKRRAVFLIDPPSDANDKEDAKTAVATYTRSKNAAFYFPRVYKTNPLNQNRLEPFAPSGAVAGVIARTDVQRGVWKAPAGQEATLAGVPALTVKLTDEENGELNPLGVNCLRTFAAAGRVVWGARTLRGHDQLADEWKYLPVRRLALFIEESLYRGTQWVVFEPNDEPLWSQIRLNVGSFMHGLFRQGAFAGGSPRDAYFVKCDRETTTQDDVNRGIVNVVVGFAPLKPAEFVIIKLQQMAGQLDT
ncbi:MAG TPA: phage tail sheath subtilisin-like domain-containing protein [Longimicrobium sp.]|nr:phage tail sheath subtilisin-like domain-containing protein [Longimicrobium sp.]